jgi:hypothetical protein
MDNELSLATEGYQSALENYRAAYSRFEEDCLNSDLERLVIDLDQVLRAAWHELQLAFGRYELAKL